jgi:hypothetical protein
MTKTFALLLSCLVLSACGRDGDDYPRLLPTDVIMAEPAVPGHAIDATQSQAIAEAPAQDKAQALRRRADALRGPVIEPDQRARMDEKIVD